MANGVTEIGKQEPIRTSFDWVAIAPKTTTGSDSFVVSVPDNYTGRELRELTLVFSAVGVEGVADLSVTIKQYPKTEFININNITSTTFSKESLNIEISGVSNSAKILITLPNEGITMVSTLAAVTIGEVTSNETITSKGNGVYEITTTDLGKESEYEFKLTVNLTENVNSSNRNLICLVSNGQSLTASRIFNQNGEVEFIVSPNTIEFNNDGSLKSDTKTITVQANPDLTWTVSKQD